MLQCCTLCYMVIVSNIHLFNKQIVTWLLREKDEREKISEIERVLVLKLSYR